LVGTCIDIDIIVAGFYLEHFSMMATLCCLNQGAVLNQLLFAEDLPEANQSSEVPNSVTTMAGTTLQIWGHFYSRFGSMICTPED